MKKLLVLVAVGYLVAGTATASASQTTTTATISPKPGEIPPPVARQRVLANGGGPSVAISGSTAILSEGGGAQAYVFTRTALGWQRAAKLRCSDSGTPSTVVKSP